MSNRSIKKTCHLTALLLLALMLISGQYTCAEGQNYLFDRDGNAVREPDAYRFYQSISGKDLGLSPFNKPSDICIGRDGSIYIADTGNKRIVVINQRFELLRVISLFETPEGSQGFSSPEGLFVTDDEKLYVADADRGSILVFDQIGEYLREFVLDPLQTEALGDDFIYKPQGIAVDHEERMYVISKNNANGLIQLDRDGGFMGYFGAVKVTLSPWDVLIRALSTEAHRQRQKKAVPTVFSGIDIDNSNFIYGVVESEGLSFDPDIIVQRLNLMGNDVLRREGRWKIVGDVQYTGNERSRLVDVSVGQNGTYSVLDTLRSHIFTYDYDGNLMYVLGASGSGESEFASAAAIDTFGDFIYILDKNYGSVTVFEPTDYGRLINEAVKMQYERKYTQAFDTWSRILSYSSRNEAAYSGMGKALFSRGEYASAMRYFEMAQDTDNYARAFVKERRRWLNENFYLLIAAIVIASAIIGAAVLLLKNRNGKLGKWIRRALPNSVRYTFHVMAHPFDGFWWLKRERIGSFPASIVFLMLMVIDVTVLNNDVGFSVNPSRYDKAGLLTQFVLVTVPFLLWCVCSWCVSTLLDGEGSFRDIFISSAYALVPFLLFSLPAILISHVISAEEVSLFRLILGIGAVWSLALLLIGQKTTHQYSMMKTLGVIFLTLLSMLIVFVLALVLFSLIRQLVNFIIIIYTELSLRR